jgi:hypothetical protein
MLVRRIERICERGCLLEDRILCDFVSFLVSFARAAIDVQAALVHDFNDVANSALVELWSGSACKRAVAEE